jgi:DNA-binding MurR/RpiR family transcriptional regulator
VNLIWQKSHIYVIGSRLSYTFAYYLGWSLSKIRSGIQIMRGSDNTTLDWLTIAPAGSVVILLATTRYPNDLIRLAKAVRRLEHILVVIADSGSCPLTQFAHEYLIAQSRHIPFIGTPSAISCLINFLVQQLASMQGTDLGAHQTKLEQCYLENDLLFNLQLEREDKIRF